MISWILNNKRTAILVAIVIVLLTLRLGIDVSVDTMSGYAGEPIEMPRGEIYRVLYFQPDDLHHTEEILVVGTHIQAHNKEWTSVGKIPEEGEFIEVTEIRLFWRLPFTLIHGWGITE